MRLWSVHLAGQQSGEVAPVYLGNVQRRLIKINSCKFNHNWSSFKRLRMTDSTPIMYDKKRLQPETFSDPTPKGRQKGGAVLWRGEAAVLAKSE